MRTRFCLLSSSEPFQPPPCSREEVQGSGSTKAAPPTRVRAQQGAAGWGVLREK